MAKPSLTKTPDNLAITVELLADPSYYEYTIKKGDKAGEQSAVCNLYTGKLYKGFKSFIYRFVTFNKDMAAALAASYRKGDQITITQSKLFPCKEKQQDGGEKEVLKYKIIAYEVNEPEGYGEDDVAGGADYEDGGDPPI